MSPEGGSSGRCRLTKVVLMNIMERHVAFPFSGERFPESLGAVIQRTVLDGTHRALYVAHTSENDWVVGEGINDPNRPGAAAAAHIRHPWLSGCSGLGGLRLGD
jgi:hypothetical protein